MTTRVTAPKTGRLPPELLGSVPREVRLTSGGIATVVTMMGFVVAALIAAIVMTLSYTQSSAEAERREREAVYVSAEILRVDMSRDEHPRRTVTYRYAVDGLNYTGRTRLREKDERRATPGGSIAIAHLQSEPETSWIAGYRFERFPLVVIPFIVFFLLAIAGVLAFTIRRQWMLLSEGRGAEARVTEVKKVRSDKRTIYRLSYEFRTLSGARQTARCDVGKTPPPVGATLPVVYHRDQPDWSAVYPLQLVKPGRLVH